MIFQEEQQFGPMPESQFSLKKGPEFGGIICGRVHIRIRTQDMPPVRCSWDKNGSGTNGLGTTLSGTDENVPGISWNGSRDRFNNLLRSTSNFDKKYIRSRAENFKILLLNTVAVC